MHLLDLVDDILFIVFSYLDVVDILTLRTTCKRLQEISYSKPVWQNACDRHVLSKNLPFPYGYGGKGESLKYLDTNDLERATRHALRLHRNWTSARPEPAANYSFKASDSNIVTDVRFVLRRGHQWLVSVSKGIWSVITCWDYGNIGSMGPRKVGEWMRKGALIKGVIINSDPECEECIVVAYTQNSINRVEISSIDPTSPSEGSPSPKVTFTSHFSLETNLRPVALTRDIIVLSDDFAETELLEWRTGRIGLLRATDEAQEDVLHDKCLAVLFAHQSVFVIRARSLDLFPIPDFRQPTDDKMAACYPITSYSFGWIDSVAIAPSAEIDNDAGFQSGSSYPAISILLRAESDNPWSSNIHRLRRYILLPNPLYTGPQSSRSSRRSPSTDHSSPVSPKRDISEYFNSQTGFYYDPTCPYLFPPKPTAHIPALRGFLRCPDVALGSRGSALWIQPRPRTARVGLTVFNPEVVEGFQGIALEQEMPVPVPVTALVSGHEWNDPDEVPQHHSLHVQARGARALLRNFREECLCAALFVGPLSGVDDGAGRDGRSGNAPFSSSSGGFAGSSSVTAATPNVGYVDENNQANEDQDESDDGEDSTASRARAGNGHIRGRRLWVNNVPGVQWTSMDYDEGTGRIALGGSDGSVTLLFM